jgi:hypothetical protein
MTNFDALWARVARTEDDLAVAFSRPAYGPELVGQAVVQLSPTP